MGACCKRLLQVEHPVKIAVITCLLVWTPALTALYKFNQPSWCKSSNPPVLVCTTN